jgi:hypothetical protein
MNEILKMLFDSIVPIIGIGGFIWGIFTYNKAQNVKKAEIIFPLIKEFDECRTMDYAKDILDEKIITIRSDHFPYTFTRYDQSDLKYLLRNHQEGDIEEKESKVRKSFDSLLDFFCKLDYLLEIKLIEKREILYFRYYVDKVVNDVYVIKYIDIYKFPLHGNLHESLEIED